MNLEWVSVVIPVYNDGMRALAAASAMLRQTLPESYALEVILVDDGSTDDTPAQLASCNDIRVRMVVLPRNAGRSAARNSGVAAARGEIVVFMDCDCIPADGYLAAHVDALIQGAVASTGHVTGDGNGFWSRYQQEASARRRRQYAAGVTYAGSSQNLAVWHSAFDAAGGFDTGYERYGFEDRDLLLRMSQLGEVVWSDVAWVSHRDTLTASQVAAKLTEAAEYSSQRFLERHRTAYKLLGYAAIDSRVRPWLAVPSKVLSPLASAVAAGFDATHGARWLPYFFAKWVVMITGAVSYLAGTARARQVA